MHLIQADRDRARHRDRATFAAWGAPFSLDAYVAAEARLRDHPWGRARSVQWQLVSDADEVLCSCETYRMTSRVEGEAGHTYGVASVFTDSHLRGRGYAGDLLDRAGAALAAADPAAQALVLYSYVAPELYQRMGYAARPALERVFEPLDGPPGAGVDRLLDEAGAAAALAALAPPPGRFVVAPEPAQLDWHLERERIICGQAGRPRPAAWGAAAGGGLVLWTADPVHDQLQVLLLQAPGPAAAGALAAAARRAAGAAGLAQAVLWGDPAQWPGLGGRVEDRAPRRDGIPMIRPLDPRIGPGDWAWIPRILWL